MESIPPGLRNLLEKCFQDTKVVSCSISSGSNPGDNVIGKMVAAKITTADGENHDLIVKAAVAFRNEGEMELTHDEKLFARVVSAFGFFQTELALYQRILPGVTALGNHQLTLPTPKIYFGQNDEETWGINSCLILEDLRPKGYKMADKMKCLTKEEVIMVLEKIASFHASSYVYLKKAQVKAKDEADPLSIHIFDKVNTVGPAVVATHQKFIRDVCSDMYEMGKEKKGISEELYQKIRKLTPDPRTTILTASRKASEEFFAVVIHGDLWVNNILFRYDDQDRPVDVSFIDFQQCRYASVFDELHYFLYTSTTAAFRKEHLDSCLDLYYAKFQDAMHRMGNDPHDTVINNFTKEAFRTGYRKYLDAAFCYGVVAIPFQAGIPPESSDIAFGSGATANNSDDQDDNNDTSGAGDEIANGSAKATENSADNDDEFVKFSQATLDGLTINLRAAARNSQVALTRFAEFCVEMNELGVFNEK